MVILAALSDDITDITCERFMDASYEVSSTCTVAASEVVTVFISNGKRKQHYLCGPCTASVLDIMEAMYEAQVKQGNGSQ